MAHLSRWLEAAGLPPGDLTPTVVGQFVQARRAEGYVHLISARAMGPMLDYLRGVGAVPPEGAAAASTAAEHLIGDYKHYLVAERGLAAESVRSYLGVAHRFLGAVSAGENLELEAVDAAIVTRFVLAECSGRSTAWAKAMVTGLRSLLGYLYLDGQVRTLLTAAVPTAACWQLAALPRGITRAQVTALLDSCDQRTALGRRDLAIVTVLARLGLRAREVAELGLADIDWRNGEIMVHGKGGRAQALPLPSDVGEAIARWLQAGRPPDAAGGSVFTRMRAPHDRLASGGVAEVVRRACLRVGIDEIGPHRLRHTTAAQILDEGGSLQEISQVLRHASLGTTAIYAKVDMAALAMVAQPWPGTQRGDRP